MKFSDDIKYIKGVGEARATGFRSLGVSTVGELLRFYPRAYEDWSKIMPISQCILGENVCIKGTVMFPVKNERVRGGMLIAKATRSGCNLSAENAVLLAEMCGRDLTLLSNEVQKLCDYTGSGEITRDTIDLLVPKPIDSSVYSLAGELFAGRTDRALGILSDLFEQRVEPIMIMAALSGHFVDCYRLKLAQAAKKTINNAMTIYGYPKYRYYGLNQLFGSVRGLSVRYVKECIDILYRTNMLLNSSKADSRILLEQAITEISVLKRN